MDAKRAEALALYRANRPEAVAALTALAAGGDRRDLLALGYALKMVCRYEEAEAAFRRASAIKPLDTGAAEALAQVVLGQGRWAEGFALFEQRRTRVMHPARELPFPEWQGEDLTGKRLLVVREQGAGDQMLTARFLPHLGCEVTYAGPPELQRLLAPLVSRYVATDGAGGAKLERHDYWTPSLSLPHRVGVTPETLRLPPIQVGAEAGGQGIGFVGQGNPFFRYDACRSLPDHLCAEVLSWPGVVDLRPQATGARDFADTAEIISSLACVVSSDTSVAHLAGLMGKPVFILLAAFHPDWRWMRERPDTPWYPSARLIRQANPGDWAEVVERVVAELS